MKSKILRGKLFRYLIYILPGIVLYYLLPYLKAIEGETMLMITTRLCVVYIIGCILFALNTLLLTFYDFYKVKDKQRSRPLKGLIQIFQVILFFIGGIIIVSVLINKSPTTLFAGLGASGDGVAHFAHLGGMVFGLLLFIYWKKKNDNHGQLHF